MSAHTTLRMSAYYYSFTPTGAPSVDRVLSAVACAGKAFHSTDQWAENCEAYMSETKGNSCVEWIQNAANDAAAERADLLAALEWALPFADGNPLRGRDLKMCANAHSAIAKARGGK